MRRHKPFSGSSNHRKFTISGAPPPSPERTGFADGVMGRPASCPWKGWENFGKQKLYLRGYWQGYEHFRDNRPKGPSHVPS